MAAADAPAPSNASPFNPRLVAGMIAAGIAAFAALLLLTAYGGGTGATRDGRAHALSPSAVGFKGLVALVGEFREAHLDESRSEWADHLLIVTLEPHHRPEEVKDLVARRGGEPTLIVLPKWLTIADPARRGWVRAVGPHLGIAAGSLLGEGVRVSPLAGTAPRRVRGTGLLEGISYAVPGSPQQISGDDLVPLAPLPGGGTLIARIGDGPLYVVADPDLLNNHGLDDPAAARAALATIDRMNGGRPFVDFDLTMNGLGGGGQSATLLRLAFEPPFLAMTLALFAAALLAGLHGAARFGPVRRARRAIAFGKAALVENSAGLIRLADRETRLGPAYVDVVRQEAARRAGAPGWLRGEALDRYLDRLGKGGPSFSELAADLHRARDRHALMAAARALSAWKREAVG